MVTTVPEKDPPDRLATLIVCQTQEEAQHVPPAQHELEAGDLAEVQLVHPVLDAVDHALAATEVQHVPPTQQVLVAVSWQQKKPSMFLLLSKSW